MTTIMKKLILISMFFLAGCASTDMELFEKVLLITEVKCLIPRIEEAQVNAYNPKKQTVYLRKADRTSDDIRLHEFMHHVSTQCLTPSQREELVARYAPYYIQMKTGGF